MEYIVFGAGVSGKRAMDFLGYDRVLCFADNKCAGQEVSGKNVVSFDEMQNLCRGKNIVVIIASEKYWEEMERQVADASSIKRYFVFREADVWKIKGYLPSYALYRNWIFVPYVQTLAYYRISQYKRIAIYGTNPYLHYLLLEIELQNPWAEVCVIPTGEEENCMGKRMATFEQCESWMDCLLINVKPEDDDIRERLAFGKRGYSIADLYEVDDFIPMFRYDELVKYKKIHEGKRVFIVGNGPSLRLEDLDTLHRNQEICIAANKIYRLYDKVDWRADYLTMIDQRIIEDCEEELEGIEGTVLIGDVAFHQPTRDCKSRKVQYFHYKTKDFYPNCPRFSEDFVTGFYRGASVTYVMIQMAVYMGFTEIYLLGVDHNFVGQALNVKNHFAGYHMEEEAKRYVQIPPVEEITKAYEMAKRYTEESRIKIYNATRGGKLEVFERVEFDKLFDSEK